MSIKNNLKILQELDFHLKTGEKVVAFEMKNKLSSPLNAQYIAQLRMLKIYENILKHEPFMKFLENHNIKKVMKVLYPTSQAAYLSNSSFDTVQSQVENKTSQYKNFIIAFESTVDKLQGKYSEESLLEIKQIFSESKTKLGNTSLRDFISVFEVALDRAKEDPTLLKYNQIQNDLNTMQLDVFNVKRGLQFIEEIKTNTINQYASLNEEISYRYSKLLSKTHTTTAAYRSDNHKDNLLKELFSNISHIIKKAENSHDVISPNLGEELKSTFKKIETIHQPKSNITTDLDSTSPLISSPVAQIALLRQQFEEPVQKTPTSKNTPK